MILFDDKPSAPLSDRERFNLAFNTVLLVIAAAVLVGIVMVIEAGSEITR